LNYEGTLLDHRAELYISREDIGSCPCEHLKAAENKVIIGYITITNKFIQQKCSGLGI
jgi:hypothetical protein